MAWGKILSARAHLVVAILHRSGIRMTVLKPAKDFTGIGRIATDSLGRFIRMDRWHPRGVDEVGARSKRSPGENG